MVRLVPPDRRRRSSEQHTASGGQQGERTRPTGISATEAVDASSDVACGKEAGQPVHLRDGHGQRRMTGAPHHRRHLGPEMNADPCAGIGPESKTIIGARKPHPRSGPPSVVASDMSIRDVRDRSPETDESEAGLEPPIVYAHTVVPRAKAEGDPERRETRVGVVGELLTHAGPPCPLEPRRTTRTLSPSSSPLHRCTPNVLRRAPVGFVRRESGQTRDPFNASEDPR